MDFFGHQERAQRRTTLLLVHFVLVVALVVIVTYAILGTSILFFTKPPPQAVWRHDLLVTAFELIGELIMGPRGFLRWLWEPWLALGIASGIVLGIALGSLYKLRQLARDGGAGVAELLGGRRVALRPEDLDEQKFRHVVEEMAIASGMPIPDIFVLANESSINAFAAGQHSGDIALAVTRGALKLLTRDELQGVVAHEFSHILRGDTRLNMRLMGLAHGILWPVIVGRLLVRGESGEYLADEDWLLSTETSIERLPFVALGLGLNLVGCVGLPFVRWLKSAICRQREWLADAAAVQFTRNPAGLAGALKKVGGLRRHGRLRTAHAETASHLYLVNSARGVVLPFLSTHPPLVKRIQALEPTFNGDFARIKPLPPTQAERDQDFEDTAAWLMAVERRLPEELVSEVGSFTVAHLRRADAIRRAIPVRLVSATADPAEAAALVYALLLSAKPEVRPCQLAGLQQHAGGETAAFTRQLADETQGLDERLKLPLVDLALPALRQIEPADLEVFIRNVETLIAAAGRMDLFEFTLHKVMLRHFQADWKAPVTVWRFSFAQQLLPDCAILLSALARLGADEPAAVQAAFKRGAAIVDAVGRRLTLLPLAECGLTQIDAALDQVALAKPAVKRNILLACAHTVAADGYVGRREGELLRAIADTLDCPVPPFVTAMERA